MPPSSALLVLALVQSPQYTSPAGVTYRALQDTSGRIAAAAAALAQAPDDVELVLALGLAQAVDRQYREAIATFTRGIALAPRDAMLYRWRGHRYLSVRQFDSAQADLERALALDPGNYGALYHLGIVRYVTGDPAGAAPLFRRAIPLAPNPGEFAGSVDWLWMSLSRAGARDEAARVLERYGDSVTVDNAYAVRLRFYRGQRGPASAMAEAGTDDISVATASYGIGTFYLVRGDTTRALDWFRRAVGAHDGWPAFGFMAAEADLARLERPAAGYTRADTLRGAPGTPGRFWWDVLFYDLRVAILPRDSTLRGSNAISYRALHPGDELQIDLMAPLVLDSVVQDGDRLPLRRDGNAWFARVPAMRTGEAATAIAFYHGHPRVAVQPPWQGGFTWTTDSLGRPWLATTAQGVGASIWWPNKDTQADEPDSQRVALTVPSPLVQVTSGRLESRREHPDGTVTYTWMVRNPINNYAIAVAAGQYAHFADTLEGAIGPLTLDYWPIDYHLEAARAQFAQAPAVLQCFEEWFGPYPWYEDGFKLIEVPYNGMEHQSAVAYGNHYANGYRGRDLSGTGLGLEWDFIIVHETAHEWWGNSVTTRDLADMWVHESFANYAEGLYTECRSGPEAGARYLIGSRRGIQNDRPIIPPYGVNAQGSGDMYPKGGNMLHTIRRLVDDDEQWRNALRGLQQEFRHALVTGAQVEAWLSDYLDMDLGAVFDQYLRTTMIPVLEYRIDGDRVYHRWASVVPGFAMRVRAHYGDGRSTWLEPTEQWSSLVLPLGIPARFAVDPGFYVHARDVGH